MDKDSLIKKYYKSLIYSLLGYLVIAVLVQILGAFNIVKSLLVFIPITLIYYLIVKNSLQKYYANKISEIDSEFKAKEDERNKLKKDKLYVMLPFLKTKWYKNTTLIYIIIIVGILLIYTYLN